MSVGELLARSRSAQAAARLATTRSGDDELDEEVYAATAKEIEAGLLREPFEARELDERLGLWTPARRFGLRQNNKVRPVDDFSEYGQNATLQTYFKVDLGGVDEVAALARSLQGCVTQDGEIAVTDDGSRTPRDTAPRLGEVGGAGPGRDRTPGKGVQADCTRARSRAVLRHLDLQP